MTPYEFRVDADERERLAGERRSRASSSGAMTPDEFRDRMQDIIDNPGGDAEVGHIKADELMEELLISLGYEEGVTLMRGMMRWYA